MNALDDETDVVPHATAKPLPDELQQYLGSLRGFFAWLHQPSSSQVATHFTASMIRSGGTVSQFMLDLFEAADQKQYPWSMLDDAYAVRTAVGKVSAWLKGCGVQCAQELEAAIKLRAYQS